MFGAFFISVKVVNEIILDSPQQNEAHHTCKWRHRDVSLSKILNSLHAGFIFHAFDASFFFRNTIRVSNGLDQDQEDILLVLIWVQTV